VGKIGGPLISFGGGEVVIENLLCVLRVDVYDPFLNNQEIRAQHIWDNESQNRL
jgi:hypothetical protein